MKQRIAHMALLVKDYDEAIDFYTQKLGFTVVEDTQVAAEKRWVLISPAGERGCCLLLAKTVNDDQIQCIGRQAGGRVFLFLYTDDFWRDYKEMEKNNIFFVRPPRQEKYGMVCVFKDLYGNMWDLIEPGEC